MPTTAPMKGSPQPLPVEFDKEEASRDATERLHGDSESEPAVPNEPMTAEETRESAEKPEALDQRGSIQQRDKIRDDDDDDATEKPTNDEVQAPGDKMEPLIWTKELEALKEKLLELEKRAHPESNNLSGQSSHDQENDPATPEMADEYRRALENLYTLRKHWETTQGPGFWRGSYDIGGGRRRHIFQGHEDEGPILPESRRDLYSRNLIISDKQFERPSLSKMLDDHVLEFSQRSNGLEQRFDTTIAYGKRRERLRQNFEWDLDRLYMEEEMQQMRMNEEEEARIVKDREKIDEEGKPGKDSQASEPDKSQDIEFLRLGTAKTAEPEPTVELRYVDWYSYGDWFRARRVGEIATVEVLLGEPVDFETGPRDRMFYEDVRPLLRRRPEGFKQPPRMTNGRGQLPERVRIHSKGLIAILAQVLGKTLVTMNVNNTSAPELPLVIVRPFKALVFCHEKLQKMAASLEKKLTPRVDSDQEADPVTAQSEPRFEARTPKAMDDQEKDEEREVYDRNEREDDGENDEEENYREVSFITTPTALRHLRCLLKFLNEDVLSRREYLSDDKCSRIWFSDMDLLFSPGTHVIEKNGKQAYKVIDVQSPRHQKNPRTWAKAVPCSVVCIYIDFDGKAIGPVCQTFEIPRFDGEKDVTALPVYPLRFCGSWRRRDFSEVQWKHVEGLSDDLKFRYRLVARGQKFLEAAAVKQMYYTGPTLDTREDVESQVVIDFDAAFSGDMKEESRPLIEPLPVIFERLNKNSTNTEDDAGSESSSERGAGDGGDMKCRENCCFGQQILAEDFTVSRRGRAEFLESLLPQAQSSNTQASISVLPRALGDLYMATKPAVSENDLLIMSFRVFGFVLRNRKWAQLDVDHLFELYDPGQLDLDGSEGRPGNSASAKNEGPARKQIQAFDRLVLQDGHRDMIVSLITQHFRDKAVATASREQVDIVRGKGRGLIVLLHGAPGVGKTSTAEAVAELFHKTLFQITCGDLGTTASEVEKSLEINFALANRWGCILLLDEADVFLAQRNKEDFIRNGLVAVFLRVMEYYSGILFLTTNRIGDFDEAFTSRIHMSLYYPELNDMKTVEVFNINLKMIQERFTLRGRTIEIDFGIASFALQHFQAHPKARWNGRQIRNACQTALALAEFEAQGNSHDTAARPDLVVKLNVKHFEKVRDAYLEFTRYINEIYQTDAKGRAKEGKIRAVWIDDEDFAKLSDKRKAFVSASQGQPIMNESRQASESMTYSQQAASQAGLGQQHQRPGQQQFFHGSNFGPPATDRGMPNQNQNQANMYSQHAPNPNRNQAHMFSQPVPNPAGQQQDRLDSSYAAAGPASFPVYVDRRGQHASQHNPAVGAPEFEQGIQAMHEQPSSQRVFGQEASSDFTTSHGTTGVGGYRN